MAHLSGDEALIAAFESGHDFHQATAARVFDIAARAGRRRDAGPDQGDELRPGLRAVRLRAVRRSSASRWPRRSALKEEYFEEFGGVRDFLNAIVAQARNDGYTETILGRRRYLPDLTSDNRQRREMAERMALNAPIQGSAADIIKVAMLNVQQRAAARRRWAPGCCSRSTTSSCSRWPRGSWRRCASWSPTG